MFYLFTYAIFVLSIKGPKALVSNLKRLKFTTQGIGWVKLDTDLKQKEVHPSDSNLDAEIPTEMAQEHPHLDLCSTEIFLGSSHFATGLQKEHFMQGIYGMTSAGIR